MQTKTLMPAVVALISVVAGGCSSEPPPLKLESGALTPGTAEVSVNGAGSGASKSLQCVTNSYLTTLDISDDGYSVVAMVSNAGEPAVAWVRMHGVEGFSGGYSQGLGGNAQVTMTGATYHITGDIYGVGADSPEPTSGTFKIDAAC